MSIESHDPQATSERQQLLQGVADFMIRSSIRYSDLVYAHFLTPEHLRDPEFEERLHRESDNDREIINSALMGLGSPRVSYQTRDESKQIDGQLVRCSGFHTNGIYLIDVLNRGPRGEPVVTRQIPLHVEQLVFNEVKLA
jgi:hypothetical protein